MRLINDIIIHCSATRDGHRLTFEDCKKLHTKPKSEGGNGWRDIGYHFYVERDGSIHYGRPLSSVGAHVRGHNTDSVGICYEGGLDKDGNPKDTRTDNQKSSIIICILMTFNYIRDTQPQRIKSVTISGHRDFSPDLNGDGTIQANERIKECPCFDAKPEYECIPR